MSDIIDKCYNCGRCHNNLETGIMTCDVGNKNKVLYDGSKHTEEYYWCNGKYQQQLGKEGRSLFDDLKNNKIFQSNREYQKFKNNYDRFMKQHFK